MAIDKNGINEVLEYTLKSELVKSLNILSGIIKGIAIDGKITPDEVAEVNNWYHLHKSLLQRQSFDDLLKVLGDALEDGRLSAEERANILWVCDRYTAGHIYHDMISSDVQNLYGLLYGIIADNKVELLEIKRLNAWLIKNEHLRGIYPYDELCRLITYVLEDGQLTPDECNLLKLFFSEFVDTNNSINLDENELQALKKSIKISGICAVQPKISFEGKLFAFTGISAKVNRAELIALIDSRGGTYKDNVVKETAYLIVGSRSCPDWAFSCYGRKVEQAVKLRKAGSNILIIHENDFWEQAQSS